MAVAKRLAGADRGQGVVRLEGLPTAGVKRPGRYVSAAYVSGGAVFATCFAVYVSTMSRGISGGDAGELAVSACQLGVAHPPGYPTFTWMYHGAWRLAAHLPHAESVTPALVFNLLSVVLSSISATVLFSSIFAMTRSAFVAYVTSLTFAFSPTVWLYSGQAEVFALHLAFVSVLLRLTIWVFDAPSIWRASVCAFMSGLALTNQHTTALFVAPIATTLIAAEWKMLVKPSALAAMTASFLAGLTPYGLLYISSSTSPVDSWGDLTTLQGFVKHVLRQEYGTLQLGGDEIASKHPLLRRLAVYLQYLLKESVYVFSILAAAGAFAIFARDSRRRVSSATAFLFAYAVYVVVFHSLANLDLTHFMLGVQMRFWMQPNMIVFLLAGYGWHWARHTVGKLIDAICIGALAVHVGMGMQNRDFSRFSAISAYGESILNSMPANATVLLNGDLNNNAVKYLYGCEGRRHDLSLVSIQLMSWPWFIPRQGYHYPDVAFPGLIYHPFVPGGFSMKDFLDANWGRAPIYLCGDWKEGDTSQLDSYEVVPSGICNYVSSRRQPLSKSQRLKLIRRAIRSLPDLPEIGSGQLTPDLWEYIVYSDIWSRKLALFNDAAGVVFASCRRHPGRLTFFQSACFRASSRIEEGGRPGCVPC
ncbi:hypothetical protein PBRA_002202 [Plasmodiophora brassicae]|uniref:DUF2723 domain-containing protein n=1 Tax=Plasmodiophora brassicae TaxID=37360 RepID=A0A0G4J337_PLABS|nr:hypothetical protein PBRA_002202 [Plasmodiophora brassicae]